MSGLGGFSPLILHCSVRKFEIIGMFWSKYPHSVRLPPVYQTIMRVIRMGG